MSSANMNIMAVQTLDRLEEVQNQIAQLLVKNTDLFKLLRDANPNPLAEQITEQDIEDMTIEFLTNGERNSKCRLFFEPFIPEVQDGVVSQIRIFPSEISPINVYEADVFLDIEVIVHQSISRIMQGRRRDRILSELLKSLNGQEVKMIRPLMLVDRSVRVVRFASEWWGWIGRLKTGVTAPGRC